MELTDQEKKEIEEIVHMISCQNEQEQVAAIRSMVLEAGKRFLTKEGRIQHPICFDAGRETERKRFERIAKACKAEVHLNVNGEATNYETLREYLERRNTMNGEPECSQEEVERFVSAGRVYELQFYPDTPVGSYSVMGADFDEVLTKAEAILFPLERKE